MLRDHVPMDGRTFHDNRSPHTLQTTILKGIMTGGREIRRVIGQAEVNFVWAGMEETDRLSRA